MSFILPVIIGTVLSFILGFLWFGPIFGKKWAQANGINTDEACTGKPPLAKMGIEFLNCLIVAAGFRWLLMVAPHASTTFPFLLALIVGVAFSLTRSVSRVIWADRPKCLILIEGSHGIASLLLLALIYNFI